jgi:hypothetical protein
MRLRITGVPPYDGEYQLDESRLTNRDIHTIKKITGYVPLEYEDAGARGDMDFVVAFAIIALRRSERFPKIDEDLIWDAELGKVELLDEEDADAVPPTTLEPETGSTPSGEPGKTGSELHQVRSLPATGTESSAT